METAFGVEAVEDDAVNGDGDDLDDDLDKGADERPVLQAADQGVVDILVEKRFPFAAFTAPAPHVLSTAVSARFVKDCSTDGPHDNTEDKECNGEDGVIDCGLFGSTMTTAEVGKNNGK